jgi:hypothetical protein
VAADDFKELLARMPEIAKAVNGFTSDVVQQEAFAVLVGALGTAQGAGGATPRGQGSGDDSGSPARTSRARKTSKKATPTKAASAKRAKAKAPTVVASLNLRPNGKTALEKFATEKAPESAQERNVVIVYYLKEVLKLGDTTVDHVFTCYRAMKWKLPSNLRNSLAITKSKKGWLDAADMDSIQLTTVGTNYVEHDLPKKS